MKFLTSMMLLGLTKAQLDVYRAKAFTIGTLTPLDRLLNLGDNVEDNLVLEVKCDDNTNSREFWYNGIGMDTIGTPVCPSYYGEEGDGTLEIAGNPMTCPDQVGSFPEENALSDQYTQTGGSLICDAHADVEFKLYK